MNYFIAVRRREPLQEDKWIIIECFNSYDEVTDKYNSLLRQGVDYYDMKLLGEV